jgi:hypothetical protein
MMNSRGRKSDIQTGDMIFLTSFLKDVLRPHIKP